MTRPLKIALCEDKKEDMDLLYECIRQSKIITLCDAFSSCEKLLSAFAPGDYDLIFLDIYMDGMSGIDAASKIRQMDTSVMLVFTTTSLEHTLESYRLKAPIYIEKPVTFKEIQEALKLALEIHKTASYVSLLIDGIYQDIPMDSIIYFETNNHVVNLFLLSETIHASQTVKLSYIETLLPDTFFRCHHSYIVNLKYVRQIDREFKTFLMQNGDKVHIKHQLFKKAVRVYEDFLFSKKGARCNEL